MNHLLICPDPACVIEAQIDALLDGRKPAVLIPNGSKVPKLPDSVKSVTIPDGVFVYKDSHYLHMALCGDMGNALGYGIDQKPIAMDVVTAKDSRGRIVQEVVTDGRESVIEAARRTAGNNGSVTTRNIFDVLIDRLAALKKDMGIA